MNDLKGKRAQIEKTWLHNHDKFKQVYSFAFSYMVGDQKCMSKTNALMMLPVQIKNKYPLSDLWLKFLNEYPEENIFKDQWDMGLEFLKVTKQDLSNFNEDDAWPLICIDFAEWFKNGCKIPEGW